MAEGVGGFLERTREKILGPREVQFENGLRMVASITSPEPTVVLRSESETLLDLRTFAPEGTLIKYDPKGRWGAILGDLVGNKPPEVHIGKFTGADAIVDFLHECGHLQDDTSTDIALTAQKKYAEQFFQKDATDYSKDRLLALQEKNNAVLQAERNAWAFSLKNTRKLEQQFGVNIIEQMGGVPGIFTYINRYLGEYEQLGIDELDSMGIEVYTKEQVQQIILELTS